MLSYPKWDECTHNTSCNGGKSSSHDSMNLRFGHVLQIRTNQERCLCLEKNQIMTENIMTEMSYNQ